MKLNRTIFRLFLLFPIFAVAQSSVGIYNFDHIPQAAILNPAYDYGQKMHITAPLLSQSMFVGNTGLTAFDLLADNAVPFTDKLKATANQMSPDDFFIGQQRMDIIYAGIKKGDKQYTFGFYQETDLFSNYPKGLADLFLQGNTQVGAQYSVDGFSTQANVVGVYHFGIQQRYDSKTSLGFRAKIYSGLLDARAKNSSGTLTTVQGQNNLYGLKIDNLDFNIQTSGLNIHNEEEISTGYLLKKLFFSGNYGLGLDLGITKQINPDLYFASSVNDIGFIYYAKGTTNFVANGSYYTEGIDLNYDGTTAQEYWSTVEDNFYKSTNYRETQDKYFTLRPIQWSNFLRYTLVRDRLADCSTKPFEKDDIPKTSVGAYTNLYVYNGKFFPSGSIFYENRLGKAVSLRAHLTADKIALTTVGAAAYVKLWKFNIFGNIDNAFALGNLAKTKRIGLQLGINYVN